MKMAGKKKKTIRKKSVSKKLTVWSSFLVVKRRGHQELFDERKIYGSIYSACSSCDLHNTDCEKIADQVVSELKKSFAGKKEINSTEIFGLVISILAKYHEDAAVMYQLHRDIS